MKHLKIFAIILATFTLISAMTGCFSPQNQELDTHAESETKNEATIDHQLNVNVMVLNGTTGFGIAPLMEQTANGKASLQYNFSVETDASVITAALLNGSADIAALPTNAAATLFNKKSDSVQVLALNTLGVLYVMTADGVDITSMSDLDGKTVYCPAQNPSFIFKAICDANNINVTIDNTYAQPADLRTMLVSGQVDIAVLPEPMVTIAKNAAAQNDKTLHVALDLTVEWDKVFTPGSLTQGCIVARKDFIEAHPAEITEFLREYKTSVTFVKENPAEAGTMIQAQGVFAQGSIAAIAIPNCNICYLDGQEMKTQLTAFYEVLATVAPASIGGKMPGNDLYYIGQ